MTDQQIEGALRAAADELAIDVSPIVGSAMLSGAKRGKRRAVAGGAVGVAAVVAVGVGVSNLAGLDPLGISPANVPPRNAAITLAEEQEYVPANAITLEVRAEGICLVSELGAVAWPLGTFWEPDSDEVTAPDGTRIPLGAAFTGAGSEYRLTDLPEGLLDQEQNQALANCVEDGGTGRVIVLFDVPVN